MIVSNSTIAQILSDIAERLAMDDNEPFKTRAYRNAAEVIAGLEEPVCDTYGKGGLKALEKIPGVGASIAGKIEELIKKGKIAYYERIKKDIPVDVASLERVRGVGPKTIKVLYKKLGVRNLRDLEYSARKGRIKKLTGFGEKKEEDILRGLVFAKTAGDRIVLGYAIERIRTLEKSLSALPGVSRAIAAGSVRRKRETIGDVDILVSTNKPKIVTEYVASMRDVASVLAHGETKVSVKDSAGMQIDVRVIAPEVYGSALNYFTGSKEHNIALRQFAIKKGYKLNEYGLFKGTRSIARKDEKEIYGALGLSYIEPELRENTGEIEAAKNGTLPKVISYGALMGDLQVQTDWSDGANSIKEMALAAKKLGLSYMVVTDHTKRLTIAHGLDEKRIVKQWVEIDRVNKTLGGTFRVLKGTECDILEDGTLDLPDKILAQLEVVGVSVHSLFNLSKKEQTKRIVKAMENPHADILFHPTGRVIGRRDAYELDMDAIISTAKRTGTVIEIDAYPDRLDIKDEYIRKCVSAGVAMSIDSDAHSARHFDFLEHGIAQARRGWAEKKDIINAWPAEKMFERLKQH